MSLKKKLRGTGVAIVTPFRNGKVDYESLGRLISYIIDNGVDYIVTLGTTGEVPTLSAEEKREVAMFTLEATKEKVPCVMGIGGNCTQQVIDELTQNHVSQFDAVLSVSPYYNRPSQEGIFAHYKSVAEAAPVPVILYNVPARTGSNITAQTTLRLAHEVENVKGIKEASGNMVQAMHIIKDRPEDFLFVSGDDHLALPLIACGADGVISVIANSHPRAFSELIRASLQGEMENARKLQYKLLEAIDLAFSENNPAGVKCFLAEMGILHNEVRLPNVPLSALCHKGVKNFLAGYGVEVDT